MPKAWLVFYLAVCSIAACAEDETHAWTFAEAPAEDGTPIGELPVASVFATKGDRLLDFSKLLKSDEYRNFPQGTWLVWNATRHLLIAHGGPRAMEKVDGLGCFQRRAVQIVGVFGWYRGIPAGSQVAVDRLPDKELAWTARAGDPVIFADGGSSSEKAPTGFSGRIEANATEDHRVDLKAALEWSQSPPDQPLHWKIGTSFTQPEMTLTTFAWGASPTGEPWALTCRAFIQWLDGTSVQASRWVEVDGKAETVPPVSWFSPKILGLDQTDGERRTVEAFPMPYQTFLTILSEDGRKDLPSDPRLLKGALPLGLEKILPPESLKPFVTGPSWNVRDYFNHMGVVVEDGDFFGYDPVAGRLLVAMRNSDGVEFDKLEQLLLPLCFRGPDNLEVQWSAARTESSGATSKSTMRLRTSSGTTFSADCAPANGTALFHSEFEATLGERALADLRYDLRLADPYLFEGTGAATAVTDDSALTIWSAGSDASKTKLDLRISLTGPRY